MARYSNGSKFVKVVYAQTNVNGKTQLIPLELYANGALKRSK